MLLMETTLFILEIIGTIAFSISGTTAAIKKNMDLLGISILAIITAVGGGAIRDITLGITPPTVFVKPIYLIVALISCFIFIFGLIIYKRETTIKQRLKTKPLEKIINLSDSIGLGIFTITGLTVAIHQGYQDNIVLLLFVGTITGVGGGILRDVFTLSIPSVFTRYIYALASMIGAILYLGLRLIMLNQIAMMISVLIIVLIRYVSAKYKLSLPKISF